MRVTTELDATIGTRLRQARIGRGLTQQNLAKLVFISFQQLQKYENGSNRISSSRLYNLAEALGLPITYFFDDLRPATPSANIDPEFTDQVLRAARLLNDMPEGPVRDQVIQLIKTLTKSQLHPSTLSAGASVAA